MQNTSRIAHEAPDEYAQEPVATSLMQRGVFDQQAFDAAYGSGPGERNKEYAFQFAYALASQAVLAIQAAGGDSTAPSDNSALPQAVVRLATGALKLDIESFTFAMDYFTAGLAQAMPSWTKASPRQPAGAAASKLPASQLELSLVAKQAIALEIALAKSFGSQQRAILLDAMSGQGSGGEVPKMLTRARVLSERAQISGQAAPATRGRDTRTL